MMHNPPFLVIAVILSSILIQSVVAAKVVSGFSVELIHPDSPPSPFYNASLTPSEILTKNALHSMQRIKNFQSLIDQKAIQSVLIRCEGCYLMKLSFGTPAVEYFAIADTGSDLTWIQCAPCTRCYPQQSSLLDPQTSSTYQKLSCHSEACQGVPGRMCLNTSDCGYNCSYRDGSYTTGILGTDTLSFYSPSGQTAAFPTSIFGCRHNYYGTFEGAGLVGLGVGPLSLVSQIGTQIDHRFSYCLVPYSANNPSSKLIFGQESIISWPGSVSTPLITKYTQPFYYLSLEGVSIGDKTRQAASSQGKIIIDSGTTLTVLESNFYNGLETMVKETIGAEPLQVPLRPYSLCYGADTRINVPEMIFHFTGADLRLQPVNTFEVNGDLNCMLIVPNKDSSSTEYSEDNQVWHYNRNGCYSVKSGYKLLCEQSENLSQDRALIPSKSWRKIWSFRITQKIQIFLWRVLRKIILSRSALAVKRIVMESTCLRCSSHEETLHHALRGCSEAMALCSEFKDGLGHH
ncbi:hypothetical protein DITRI_Ditri02bG0150000 [Diplodiscus trichospermus]